MKVGDKIICIKEYISKRYSEEHSLKINEIFEFWRIKKNNAEDDKKYEELLNESQKLVKESEYEVTLFTIGKAYEIINIFAGSIKILDNEGEVKHFSILEGDELAPYTTFKCSEYFITITESRKHKLEELSDENFSQFLKKIKNEQL